jgi:branched-chain amino acid transport system ATP-binding protein
VKEAVLEVEAMTKAFGGVRAINDISFRTFPGEILGVIGPNGSGKTTLFNLITGVFPATSGSVRFRGKAISGLPTDAIARLGLVRTFQAATVFKQESVYENIRRGSLFGRIGNPGWFFSRGLVSAAAREARAAAEELLEFSGLSDVAGTYAGTLPYGKQKMLGVVIALAQRPVQLLMDEPAAGLNPPETEAMGELIAQIRAKRGIDVVLVEHDMRMVTSVCDRILALNYGKVIAIDVPAAIVAHPEVIEAYLGVDLE